MILKVLIFVDHPDIESYVKYIILVFNQWLNKMSPVTVEYKT